MLRQILALIIIAVSTVALTASDITGTWSGKLQVGPRNSIRLVFHIHADSVAFDSPDQNAYGISCTTKFLSTDSVSFGVSRLGMNYTGKLTNDTLTGVFQQGPVNLPLTMTRGESKPNRPQTPQPPFPYTTEEVRVKTADAVLAGTLTIPQNATKRTPVAVLVSGSGLQNRDEELFEHRPFAVIADYLARKGIATMRYDDRGTGESKGNVENATTEDFAADAEAVVNYIRNTGRFSKTGLIGHSEGGMVGYMLGAKPGVVDFIVSIAGPSVSGSEINAYQNKIALLNSGVDPLTAENFERALLKANKFRLGNGPQTSVSNDLLTEIYPEHDASPISQKLAETITAILTMKTIRPWMEYFLRFDPAESMRSVKIPIFIIYGEKDCQVPPSLNLKPAKENAPHAIIKCYAGLNHPMQHATTGNIDEYREIEETIAPEVLEDIVSFILSDKLLQK